MTRGQIKASALSEAHADESGGPGFADPIRLNEWVDEGAQELVRTCDMTYVILTSDLVDGQATYCWPSGLYYLENLTNIGSDGSTVTLRIVDLSYMQQIAPFWRSNPDNTGDPIYAVTEGMTSAELYPVPDYDQAASLTWYGYGTLDATAWASDSSPCPLPGQAHLAIVYYVAYRIARYLKSADAQLFLMDWRRQKGLVQAELGRLSEATKHRFPAGPLGMYQPFGNPLNL